MPDKKAVRSEDANFRVADYRLRQYLAEQLKELRCSTTWKQEEIAVEIARTQAQISRYESGQRLIPAEDLARIARLLQVPIQNFFPPDLAGGLHPDEIQLVSAVRRRDYAQALHALADQMKK